MTTLSIPSLVHRSLCKWEPRYYNIPRKVGVDIDGNEEAYVKDEVSLEIN
jgi:hypothetical protein